MLTQTPQNKGSRSGRDDYGKCICLSIPYHELDLIDDMDRLSHMEFCSSRSEYVRKLIRRERDKLRDQQRDVSSATWKTMFGDR